MTKFLFFTTLLATLGFSFTSIAGTEITPVLIDEPAAPSPAAVSISNGFSNVTNLGNGQYASEIRAQGTLTTINGTFSTGLALDCDVDTVGETLDCLGLIRVGTAEVAIKVEFADGTASYLLHQSASEEQRRAWVNWHEVLIIDVLPPLGGGTDTGDSGDGNDGGDGGWDLPDLVEREPWTGWDYGSDWTLILDGAVLHQY